MRLVVCAIAVILPSLPLRAETLDCSDYVNQHNALMDEASKRAPGLETEQRRQKARDLVNGCEAQGTAARNQKPSRFGNVDCGSGGRMTSCGQ